MRLDKEKAIQLRKEGKSYREIERMLKIPKSTLTGWFQKKIWSNKVKATLSIQARKASSLRMKILQQKINKERQELYNLTAQIAKGEFQKYKDDPLFRAGLMIYWGEGDNKLINGVIRVVNTDPAMLRLFHLFIQMYLKEVSHKTKAYLVLYPDLVENRCKRFWSRNIGLPMERFIKSTFISGHHPTKRLGYGMCTVIISSRAYKEKVHAWLNLIRDEIMKMHV